MTISARPARISSLFAMVAPSVWMMVVDPASVDVEVRSGGAAQGSRTTWAP
ncbi:hypothetical protein ACFFX0_01705 [Citricoccus parietis]|uniref:Uncharacterized protein n=1 Tax=Citricoccus parietis TaxID=592307 RepID=A0ABV5FTG6_9MICC